MLYRSLFIFLYSIPNRTCVLFCVLYISAKCLCLFPCWVNICFPEQFANYSLYIHIFIIFYLIVRMFFFQDCLASLSIGILILHLLILVPLKFHLDFASLRQILDLFFSSTCTSLASSSSWDIGIIVDIYAFFIFTWVVLEILASSTVSPSLLASSRVSPSRSLLSISSVWDICSFSPSSGLSLSIIGRHSCSSSFEVPHLPLSFGHVFVHSLANQSPLGLG